MLKKSTELGWFPSRTIYITNFKLDAKCGCFGSPFFATMLDQSDVSLNPKIEEEKKHLIFDFTLKLIVLLIYLRLQTSRSPNLHHEN